MIIDCDDCAVRGPACQECVVSVLLGSTPDARDSMDLVELDDTERQAVATLAGAGLIPPLRMVHISTLREDDRTVRRHNAG